ARGARAAATGRAPVRGGARGGRGAWLRLRGAGAGHLSAGGRDPARPPGAGRLRGGLDRGPGAWAGAGDRRGYRNAIRRGAGGGRRGIHGSGGGAVAPRTGSPDLARHRADGPADRRRAVHQPAHGAGPRRRHLRQARGQHPHRRRHRGHRGGPCHRSHRCPV
ncbi:MAG: hypothetical protein AVDCRST_MAG73-161, partial [uncultured Thermomicrobiales bacterium]